MAGTETYVWDWNEKRRVPASSENPGRHALYTSPAATGHAGFVVAVTTAIALMFLTVVAASGLLALLAVVVGVVIVLWWHCGEQVDGWVVQDTRTRRMQVESLAVVDAGGGCGWCGARIAHRDVVGAVIAPRHWHDAEVEEWIALSEQSGNGSRVARAARHRVVKEWMSRDHRGADETAPRCTAP